jgi:hypothetical protein
MAVPQYAMNEKVSPGPWSAYTAETINRLFERLYKSGQITAGSTPGALVNGLDVIVPHIGDLIVCTTAGIFTRLPIDATVQRVLTNNAGIPTWALVSLANGVTGLLPLGSLTLDGNAHHLLHSNHTESAVDLAADVAGNLPVGNLGSGSGAGITTFWRGDGSWSVPSGEGSQVDFIAQNFLFCSARGTSSIAWGHQAPTDIVASTVANQPDGSYNQYSQSGTSVNLRGGFNSNRRDYFRADNDPVLEAVVTTGATITQTRIYFVMSDTQTTDTDDFGGTSKYIGFRYSTIAGDGGWVGVSRDGTTLSVTATVAPINASTKYKLKIRKSGGTVFFSVNGGAEISLASNIPAAATAFGIDLEVTNAVAGSTHPILFSRYRCYYGT